MPPTTCAYPQNKQRLDSGLVCDRRNALWLVVLCAHSSCLPWLCCLSLQVDVLAGLLGLALLGCVGLDTGKELVTRSRVADVLDTDVDALLDVAVADLSVEDDADCGLGDVVDDTGLSVVDLVWLQSVLAPVSWVRGTAFRHVHMFDMASAVSKSTYHALLDGTVGDNIDDVSDLVLLEVCTQSDHALLLEVAGEGCSSMSAHSRPCPFLPSVSSHIASSSSILQGGGVLP